MNKSLLLLVLCLSFLSPVAGQAEPMASEAEDALSKQFQSPPSDMAGVYIYRDSVLMGKRQTGTVWLDGKSQGNLPDETYFYMQIAPGMHTLSGQAAPSDRDLKFEARAGENQFVKMDFVRKVPVAGAIPLVGSVVGAFASHVQFVLVEEEEGKDGVMGCMQAVMQGGNTTSLATVQPDCVLALEKDPELKPLRDKVALSGKDDNFFTLMSNDQKPTKAESKLLVKWGSKREHCFNANPPPHDAFYQLSVDTFNRGQKLILELSRSEMSYGQFAEKRREIKQESLANARLIQAN